MHCLLHEVLLLDHRCRGACVRRVCVALRTSSLGGGGCWPLADSEEDLRVLFGREARFSGRAGCWLHPGLAAGSPADSPRPGLKIRQLALIHQPPVGQRPFVSFRAMGVSRVFGLAWPTVRLALKIPGFSAADHVESPTNPGRRRSAYVPTQPHQSMSSRLLLEEPVEELVEESRVPRCF